MSMEALSASLLLFAITRYSLSTTLLRSRILSLLVSNRPRTPSTERLTSFERLLLTLADLGVRTFPPRFESIIYPTFSSRQLSYSLLRRLLPAPPPLAFSIFSLSTPLPTLFFPFLARNSPRRDALLEMAIPSLRSSIFFSALWTILHELLQLSVIVSYRSTENRHSREVRDKIMVNDRDKITGIQVRGRPLVSLGEETTAECSICLSSTFTPDPTNLSTSCTPPLDALDVFCTSCSTPLHPGCLMQWWHEKSTSQSARQPIPNTALLFSGAGGFLPRHLIDSPSPSLEITREFRVLPSNPGEATIDIVEDNVGAGDGLSPMTRDLLIRLMRDYGFADGLADRNPSIRVEVNGNSIRGFGTRGGGQRSQSVPSDGIEADTGCWGLGSFLKIVVDSPPHLPHLFPSSTTASSSTSSASESIDSAGKGVVIYLSPRYVELRSAEKSLWWWKFPQDGIELNRVRTALIDAERERSPESEVEKDPLVAIVVSNSASNDPTPLTGSTGPNCPLCRSSLTLYIHLLPPPPLPVIPVSTDPLGISLSFLSTLCTPVITSPLVLSMRKKLEQNSWYQLWSSSSHFGWKRILRRWLIQVVLSGAIAGSLAFSRRKGKA